MSGVLTGDYLKVLESLRDWVVDNRRKGVDPDDIFFWGVRAQRRVGFEEGLDACPVRRVRRSRVRSGRGTRNRGTQWLSESFG